jgi:hypothetical protein
MAQHDLIIDNASGAAVRADMNNAFAALGSTMKGSGAPPAPLAGKQWIADDSPSASTWTWRIYDGSDWITVGQIDTVNNRFLGSGVFAAGTAAAAGVSFAGNAGTGMFLPASNTLAFTAGGVERLRMSSAGAVLSPGLAVVGNTVLDGTLGVTGLTTLTELRATGRRTRMGVDGPYTDNQFNIDWNGSAANLWIDYTNVGTIAQLVSDRRIKHSIEDVPSALAMVQQLRPVTYRFRDLGVFADDGVTRWGFIADEVQAVIPSAVVGAPDAQTGGQVQPQTIIDRPIIAALTKALQEAATQISALEARIAALEASA